jgi:TolA-binding protein
VVLREQVARALVFLGTRLERQGQPARAVAVYEQVVVRFGDASDAALREHVSAARRSRARLQRRTG